MMNRHGLVAGATGTGKTQARCSCWPSAVGGRGAGVRRRRQGRPVAACRCRARPARRREKRQTELGMPFEPRGFPAEYLALGGIGAGVPVRATVSDFGPQLLAKILGANETQEQSLGLVFHYADEKGLPLLDLVRPARAADLPRLRRGQGGAEGHRRPVGGDGRRAAALAGRARGRAAATSSSASRSSTIADLLRTAPDGRGVISCLELPARAGQAEAVLDRADVAAGRAVRGRCRRPATSTSPSSCSSSTRRTCCSTTPPTRSSTRSPRPCG